MPIPENPIVPDERVSAMLNGLIGMRDAFANYVIYRSELQALLAEVVRYRRSDPSHSAHQFTTTNGDAFR